MAHIRFNSLNSFNAAWDRAMRSIQKNLSEPLEHSASWYIQKSLLKRFDREISADGKRWASLAPLTQSIRKSKGYGPNHPILRRTGNLRYGFQKSFYKKNEIMIKNRIPYASELNNGNEYTNLPARPFMGFNRYDNINVKKIFVKWTFQKLIKNLK